MKNSMSELFSRVDHVIQIADKRLVESADEMRRSQYQLIANNFEDFRQSLLNGRLPPIGSGIGFGAARGISDFCLNDEEIENAVLDTENLYRTGRPPSEKLR